MKINKLEITISILLAAICFSSCGRSTETVVNTNSVNRTNTAANVVNTNMNTVNTANSINTNIAPVNAAPTNVNSTETSGKGKQPPTKMPTPNIGSGGSDFSILMSARNAISSDKDLINAVIIEVKDGIVTLNGKVATAEQKQKAEDAVRGIQGIKGIKNMLKVG